MQKTAPTACPGRIFSLAVFLWIELTTKKPLLNLRLLVRRDFGFGVLANFLLGVALYGSVDVLPVYLSRIQGYNAEQIGMVLAWTGLPQLFLIPLVPQLMKRFDARLISTTPTFWCSQSRCGNRRPARESNNLRNTSWATASADHAEATHRALDAIGKIVQKQAYILAFSDTFYLLGVALIVALMAALLLKKPGHLESGGAH